MDAATFLKLAANVDGRDPDAPVSVPAMMERLGFRPDPDPEACEYTVASIVEKYCAPGTDTVPFRKVPVVLAHFFCSEFGPEWKAGFAAFFDECTAAWEKGFGLPGHFATGNAHVH